MQRQSGIMEAQPGQRRQDKSQSPSKTQLLILLDTELYHQSPGTSVASLARDWVVASSGLDSLLSLPHMLLVPPL